MEMATKRSHCPSSRFHIEFIFWASIVRVSGQKWTSNFRNPIIHTEINLSTLKEFNSFVLLSFEKNGDFGGEHDGGYEYGFTTRC